MSGITTAVVSAGIGAVTSIVGGIFGNSKAKRQTQWKVTNKDQKTI